MLWTVCSHQIGVLLIEHIVKVEYVVKLEDNHRGVQRITQVSGQLYNKNRTRYFEDVRKHCF